jgi:hypothetical protein
MDRPPRGAAARIYRPAKSAMQSGAGMRSWVLEFVPVTPQRLDALMGWPGWGDPEGQVTLHFPTREQAVRYAQAHGLDYAVEPEAQSTFKRKSYAENFTGPRR